MVRYIDVVTEVLGDDEGTEVYRVGLETCDDCFALVHGDDWQRHQRWHDELKKDN